MSKQIIARTYEPKPVNSRKSFGGKCEIIETTDCFRYLKSYNTIVAYIDGNGKAHRVWSGWSLTTGTHLQAIGIMNKKEWDSIPIESLPSDRPVSLA